MLSSHDQIKNTLLYLFHTFILYLQPLITLPIFTRILSREDYGALALAQIYAILATGLCNMGLSIGYERNFFKFRDKETAAELLYSNLSLVVILLLVATAGTYTFKQNLSKLIVQTPQHSELLFWAFVAMGITTIREYFFIYFKNSENAKLYVSYSIYECIMHLIFSLWLVAYLKIGIIGLVYSQIFSGSILLSIVFMRFLRQMPPRFNISLLKESFKISYPLTPRVFLGVISNQFDKFMIGLIANVGGVGIYSIAQKISYVVFSYMTALQNVYSPQVYQRMFDLKEEGGKEIGQYLTPFLVASFGGALVAGLFSEEVIYVMTPESYHDATDIVTILCMFYATMFFAKQPQLLYKKKTYIITLMSFITIVLNVSLNIPFIIKWGAIGAAWATFIAGTVSVFISFCMSQHYYKIHWEYKRISFLLVLFLVASITVILFRHTDIPYLQRLMYKLFVIVSLCVIVDRQKILKKDILLSFMPKRFKKGNVSN